MRSHTQPKAKMNRLAVLLMAALMIVGALAGPATASAPSEPVARDLPTVSATEAQNATNETNETNETDVAPGERFAGVLGVTQAEFEGELANRSFGIKVARAATPEAKAVVVAEELGDIEERLAALENRTEQLRAARANGSLSDGAFKAKMATVTAEVRTVKRVANASNRTAASLPAEVLSEQGINASEIQKLRHNADNLTGPEVSEIARNIAGPSAGTRMANPKAPVNMSQPDEPGPPDDTPGADGNQSDEPGPPDDMPGTDGNQSDESARSDDRPGNDGNQTGEAGPPDDTPGDDSNQSDESGSSDGMPGDVGNQSDESGSSDGMPGDVGNHSDESAPSDGNPGETGNQSDEAGPPDNNTTDEGNQSVAGDQSEPPGEGDDHTDESASHDETPASDETQSDESDRRGGTNPA